MTDLVSQLVGALEIAVRQGEHDMLLTGEELRQCNAALSAAKDGGWLPIETAPKDMDGLVVVRWLDSDGAVCNELDNTEDGCWVGWHEHAEQVEIIGGHGVSYTPPYTHWMPLPNPPKGEV